MKTYIGTKIIQAEPAFRIDGEIYPESGPVPRSMNREEGYRVHYPDGYESWSPKDVFEQAYLPLTVNPDLRTDAPSISQQMVDDFILETWTQTMGDKTHSGPGPSAERVRDCGEFCLRQRGELRREAGPGNLPGEDQGQGVVPAGLPACRPRYMA